MSPIRPKPLKFWFISWIELARLSILSINLFLSWYCFTKNDSKSLCRLPGTLQPMSWQMPLDMVIFVDLRGSSATLTITGAERIAQTSLSTGTAMMMRLHGHHYNRPQISARNPWISVVIRLVSTWNHFIGFERDSENYLRYSSMCCGVNRLASHLSIQLFYCTWSGKQTKVFCWWCSLLQAVLVFISIPIHIPSREPAWCVQFLIRTGEP